MDRLEAELLPEGALDEREQATIDAAITHRQLPEWLDQLVRAAARIELDSGERYLEVPADDPAARYEDLEAFIETVVDPGLRERLSEAIRGRGAFGRFRTILNSREHDLERWYVFKAARLRQRVLEWLTSEGIEPQLEDG